MKKPNLLVWAALAFLILGLAAPAWAEYQKPDYSLTGNWLALPGQMGKKVDVFWVYPTVYQGAELVAAMDDAQMRAAAQRTLQTQAAVFADAANIFAPVYRQCNMSTLKLPAKDQGPKLEIGYQDVRAAFEYYLQHLGQGRPFILAGHSQGSLQLLRLLKELPGGPLVRQRLVAAYIIGWSVTGDDLANFPALRLCGSATDTGCIVTYNCVAPGAQQAAPTISAGAQVVNPLSWTTSGALAPAGKNLGAVFVDQAGGQKVLGHFTSAQAVDGGLVVEPAEADMLSELPFGPGVYHMYDYALFFENLKANLLQRINAFEH